VLLQTDELDGISPAATQKVDTIKSGGIARVEEKGSTIATGGHFGHRDPTGHGDILKPYRQAALNLDGGGVVAAVESLQDESSTSFL
jgi:hypothetical protein